MSITAQALDGVYGRPAAGVRANLERAQNGSWEAMATSETDEEGFVCEWVGLPLPRGMYRIVFESDQYFAGLGMTATYPEIAVMFRVQDENGICRIQVLLAPHTYSTYFGTAG